MNCVAKDTLLATDLCGIKMKTPILTGSGTFGFGEEFADFVDLSSIGGVVVKGTTLKPRRVPILSTTRPANNILIA